MAASVSGSLKGIEGMLKERHNTATMAALSLQIDECLENGTDDTFETNIDTLLLEEEEEVSIDIVLGTQENENKSSEEGSVSTDSNSGMGSPLSDGLNSPMPVETDKNGSEQLDSLETVRKSESEEGGVTVTTSVTVSCSSLEEYATKTAENGTAASEDSSSQNGGGEKGQVEVNGQTEETQARTCTSTQVLISDTTPTISVNLTNYDSDDTLSGEESVQNINDAKKVAEQNGRSETTLATGGSETPPATTGESTIGNITVKEDRTGSNSSAGSNNSAELTPPQSTRRRCKLLSLLMLNLFDFSCCCCV